MEEKRNRYQDQQKLVLLLCEPGRQIGEGEEEGEEEAAEPPAPQLHAFHLPT